ncbi:MAG: chorismate synthase, partial [Candidatus Wallbacteria bacterium]|nr:chorismate synthase [Candidatus Wallbacteria bacterium]
MGVVVDGCPAGLELSLEEIRRELQRDVPDPRIGTGRKEENAAEILSGVFDGKTIGTPISIMIPNRDAKSCRYEALKHTLRPGHADYTWRVKYGHVDWRGGSRASGRECISRLAAGAVARKLLGLAGVSIASRVVEMAGVGIEDERSMEAAVARVLELSATGESTGGRVKVTTSGLPVGLGEPVFGKLSAELGAALLGIGAVKAFELGAGRQHAGMTGSETNDAMIVEGGRLTFASNNAGGTLGGISSGMGLVVGLTVKPTPSIPLPQKTVDLESGQERTIEVKGRFDRNITPRVAVVAEAMTAIVVLDHMIRSGFVHPSR